MDDPAVVVAVSLGSVALLLFLGWAVGSTREKAHLADLARREAALAHLAVTDLRGFGGAVASHPPPRLVTAEVALGSDYLKSFAAGPRNLVGGEAVGFTRLASRARREALLRLREAAARDGYDALCGLRFDASDIGGNAAGGGNPGMPMAAVLASATAYKRAEPPRSVPG